MKKNLYICSKCLKNEKIINYFFDSSNNIQCNICHSNLQKIDVSFDEWNKMKDLLENPDFLFTVNKLIEFGIIDLNNNKNNNLYTDEENILTNYGLINNTSKIKKIDYLKEKKCPQCNSNLTDEMINVNMCWECGEILDKSLADEDCLLQIEQNNKKQSLLQENKPKCPTCGSTNVEKLSNTKRWLGTSFFGLASSDIGKTMCCSNCGYKW